MKTTWTSAEIADARSAWLDKKATPGATRSTTANIVLSGSEVDWSKPPATRFEPTWSFVEYMEDHGLGWWLAKYDMYPT